MSGKIKIAEPVGTKTCTSWYTGIQVLPAINYCTHKLKKLSITDFYVKIALK